MNEHYNIFDHKTFDSVSRDTECIKYGCLYRAMDAI